MRNFTLFGIVAWLLLFVSCSSKQRLSELSSSEKNLLTALNQFRAEEGKAELLPVRNLTELARKDAQRRVREGGGYVKLREKTGYERMLTLGGRAYVDGNEGEQLLKFWKGNPVQAQWLRGSYAAVGVGTAQESGKVLRGVVLLGGYSADGI